MKLSVFGIGYVGAVTSACLAQSGHDVIAVDTQSSKVDAINQGKAPIDENGLEELTSKMFSAGRLRATTSHEQAVMESEMSLICVGTPSKADGSLDLSHMEQVCREIGSILARKKSFHIVVIRSTVLPGTLERVVKPILEQSSGKQAGTGFGLGNNPEFLREGTAIEDYFTPTQIVVGAFSDETGKRIMSLYDGIEAERDICPPEVAEGVKYIGNSWRATKVSFANEAGNILSGLGVDSHKVMDIFFKDTKINLSRYFLRPGFAFGGSCLPKDVRALVSVGARNAVPTPLFEGVLKANQEQINRALNFVKASDKTKVILLGLSFKPGTDDLRESAYLTLAQKILSETDKELFIYDAVINRSKIERSAASEHLKQTNPNIFSALRNKEDAQLKCEALCIIGHCDANELSGIISSLQKNSQILDLSYSEDTKKHCSASAYRGISW